MDLSALYTHQHPQRSRPFRLNTPPSDRNNNMSHAAFFYGTLMAPPVLHRVIWGSQTPPTPAHASLLTIRSAILPAHRRHKVRGADYPAILPCSKQGACVKGTLVEGLTDGDLWRLDIFEGDEYTRRQVRVRVHSPSSSSPGEEIDCESYIWTSSPRRLDQSEWDFDEFVRDKMKRWVGREAADADEGFQEVDDAVASLQQDPTGGRGTNGNISRQLEEGERDTENAK